VSTQPPDPDLIAIKRRQQQAWAAGDFSVIATEQVLVGELLCESVDIHAGQKVLDVATGSGNTALAAARRRGDVIGIDFVPALLERARERAAAERLQITFQHGDAENLPFPDASFDIVLSTFGAMFAPDQEKAARELLRVCRPGGKIGMANWTPDSLVGEVFRVTARHVPPPPGLKSSTLWGTEERLRELLGDGIASLRTTTRVHVFRNKSARHHEEFLQTCFGPTQKAFEALDAAGREALARDRLDILHRFNRSGDDTLVAPSTYLEVVAVRK